MTTDLHPVEPPEEKHAADQAPTHPAETPACTVLIKHNTRLYFPNPEPETIIGTPEACIVGLCMMFKKSFRNSITTLN